MSGATATVPNPEAVDAVGVVTWEPDRVAVVDTLPNATGPDRRGMLSPRIRGTMSELPTEQGWCGAWEVGRCTTHHASPAQPDTHTEPHPTMHAHQHLNAPEHTDTYIHTHAHTYARVYTYRRS